MRMKKWLLPRRGLLLGLLMGLGCVGIEAEAGAFHRCDDGSGVSIYQTRPCDAATRLVARHEYRDDASPAPQDAHEVLPGSKARTQRSGAGRGGTGSRSSTSASDHAAWECSERGRRWLQDRPCAAGKSEGGRASGTPGVSRRELCRRLRAETERSAPQERSSDAAYRRNLLRARGGC